MPPLPALILALAAAAAAKTYRATTADQLRTMSGQLAAGDTLVVAPGNYDVNGWSLSNKQGTADKWITVLGEPGAAVRSNSGCCNLVQIDNSAYLQIKGLELGMAAANPAIDGINLSGAYTHHVRFEGLRIMGMTGNGISVFSDSAHNIELLRSEIGNLEGTGLYWGYPGRDIVHDALIEGNYIHHCPKDPAAETNYGIQFKGWGYRARILNNVLHDVGGTTRSGLIIYYGKKPLAGDAPGDINIVAGNVLWNCRNEGITVMSDALVENNVVFAAGTGINLQTYSDESFSGTSVVENLRVRNNTAFRCRSSCFAISGWGSAGAGVSFTGNAAYQEAGGSAVSGSVGQAACSGNVVFGSGNLPGQIKGTGLTDFLKTGLGVLVPNLDFYPAPTSPLRDAVDAATCPADDFNGQPRPQGKACDAGAYEAGTAVNPGWGIKESFKPGGSQGSGVKSRPPAPGRRSGRVRWQLQGGGLLLFPPDVLLSGGEEAVPPIRLDGKAAALLSRTPSFFLYPL